MICVTNQTVLDKTVDPTNSGQDLGEMKNSLLNVSGDVEISFQR